MRDMVIVPLHKRPAFAWAALTRLHTALDDGVCFHIALDVGFDPQCLELAERFQTLVGAGRVTVVQRKNTYRGNSYNLLTAYREVADCGAERIHMVEEDILVAADYFTFHRDAHDADPDAFCVSAVRNQQIPIGTEPPQDDTKLYRYPWYQSLGVSFRPERLQDFLPHAGRKYFINPAGYCRMYFRNTQLNPANAEQDGLIHRVIEEKGSYSLYPCVPRAYHAGFQGYHRKGHEIPGSVEQQARRILEMSADDLNRHAVHYKDHTVVDLDADRKPVTEIIDWPT